ncbi:MAG: hypothetical protein AAGJ18_30275 [Bacteroidota bacterium]
MGTFAGGAFCLHNEVDPNAMKYQYFRLDKWDMMQSPMSLETRLLGEGQDTKAAAGLLFAFDPVTRLYWTFHVNENGEYQVWQRETNQLTTILTGRSNQIITGQYNRLGLVHHRLKTYLFINDHHVKTIEHTTALRGDCGIIAMGNGQFYFDNFQFFRS